ncbi:MAG TPA: class I SAM-dependent methyltransferase [Solirubrobacteraceae bacterium]|nr:class I SAM-dependent methyltransferase [Solirubrobacteraceae bacterium]
MNYQQSIWEALPEPSDPPYLSLRLAFLLAHAGEGGPDLAPNGDPSSRTPRRVLDVGCGEGQFAAELARAGYLVVGVDVAEEPLRRARRRHPDLDVRLVPVEADWPLADASFDVVWAGETIEHVADTAAWLSQVRRVLRSGGSLLLSTPDHGALAMLGLALSPRAFDAHFDPRSDHLRFYTRRTLTSLLADFGFQDIRVHGAGGVPGARRLLLASARRSRF